VAMRLTTSSAVSIGRGGGLSSVMFLGLPAGGFAVKSGQAGGVPGDGLNQLLLDGAAAGGSLD
jgi:hypothetical protein